MSLPPAIANALDEVILRGGRNSLPAFIRRAWELVEPGAPLVWNWHLDILCDELRGVPEQNQELVICIPPGTMKSLLVSVFWPAWLWLSRPSERLLCFANDDDLAGRDSRRMRTIISSAWYARLVQAKHERDGTPLWSIAKDQNEKKNFETTDETDRLLGMRACLSLGAKVTGKRCSGMIIDDPMDAKEVITGSVEAVRRRLGEVNSVIEKVLPTRLVPGGWKVTIMQRLAVGDPAEKAIASGVRAVVLPMRYSASHPHRYEFDPRTEEGELLFPRFFDEEFDRKMSTENRLGARHYQAQYDQNPSPETGGLFRRSYFRHRYPCKDPQRTKWKKLVLSVDATFKNTDGTDYVVLQAWAKTVDGDLVVLDQVRGRMDYPELKRAFRDFANKWRRARAAIIEEKANGAALIADLRRDPERVSEVAIIPFDPKASKLARAELAADYWRSGRCKLLEGATWAGDFIEEHVTFPGGGHDDQVDAGAQVVLYLTENESTGRADLDAVESALRKRLGWMGV